MHSIFINCTKDIKLKRKPLLSSQLSFCGHYPESEGNSSLFLLGKTSGWTKKAEY